MEESQTPTTTASSFDDVVLPAPAVRQFPLIGDDPGPRYVDENNMRIIVWIVWGLVEVWLCCNQVVLIGFCL